LSQRRLRRVPVGATAALAAIAAPALAATGTATSTLTLNTAPHILSVTVGPASVAFAGCTGGDTPSPGVMGFPNAQCQTPSSGPQLLSVSDPGQPERILVQGSDFVPLGAASTPLANGRWALCGSDDRVAPACTNHGAPGQDQYRLATRGPGGRGPSLSSGPQCDTALTPGGCTLQPGQQCARRSSCSAPPWRATRPTATRRP
jgi:hypothetical protein